MVLQLFQHLLIEVCFLSFRVLELISVHATSELSRHFLEVFTVVTAFDLTCNANFQCFDLSFLRIVEVWQLDWELESKDQLVSFIFDCLGQVDKILVHDESFLCVIKVHAWESFQHFSNVHIVNLVNFDEIFHEHVDYMCEETSLLAKFAC